MIKNGTLTLRCWDDEEDSNEPVKYNSKVKDRIDKLVSETNEVLKNPENDECPF